MTTFYKATRPDGKDFRTGTVDYAGALGTGALVRHPHAGPMIPNDPITYLSVSVEPAETLIGGAWPCRLFRIESVGDVLDGLEVSPSKRACKALRVPAELPAWQALGPNGERVAAVIDRSGRLTGHEIDKLQTAEWIAPRNAAGNAAWDVARGAAREAARKAAWGTAGSAAWGTAATAARSLGTAGSAAWDAARDAAVAELVRDLITEDRYQALAGPWLSVIGDATAGVPA